MVVTLKLNMIIWVCVCLTYLLLPLGIWEPPFAVGGLPGRLLSDEAPLFLPMEVAPEKKRSGMSETGWMKRLNI